MESIDAGDIGAGVGFKDIRTGDTLCDENRPIVLESMTFPDTVISVAVEPKSQADIAKLDTGLAKLAEEDPTFTVHTIPCQCPKKGSVFTQDSRVFLSARCHGSHYADFVQSW